MREVAHGYTELHRISLSVTGPRTASELCSNGLGVSTTGSLAACHRSSCKLDDDDQPQKTPSRLANGDGVRASGSATSQGPVHCIGEEDSFLVLNPGGMLRKKPENTKRWDF